MSDERIRIFDYTGNPIDEISATARRSWVLDDLGRCDFEIATNDTKFSEINLRYGNLVYIQHTELPDWVGVIDTPRSWKKDKVVVTAYSAERILEWRFSTENEYRLLRGTAGAMIKFMLDAANQSGGTQILAGEFFTGGIDRQEVVHDPMLVHVQGILRRARYNFDVTPKISDMGRLELYLNIYQFKGIDTGLDLNSDNTEWSQSPVTEQGQIWNDIIGFGDSVVEQQRISTRQTNVQSASKYGVRQFVQVFQDNQERSTIEENTASLLIESAEPNITVDVTANNYNNTFRLLRTGNIWRVNLETGGFMEDGSVGFQKSMRITGMEYNPTARKVRLILEAYAIAT